MDMGMVAQAELEFTPQNTLEKAVRHWLDELDTSQRTRDTYRKAIGRYVSFLSQEQRAGGARIDILAYKGHLVRSYSANTVNSYLVPVRMFYTWLSAMGLGPNLAAGIKGAKLSRSFKKDYLTVPQAKSVLKTQSHGESQQELRDSALISLMIHTGVRTIEVTRANIEDMRPSGSSTVLGVQGKGQSDKDAVVVLPESVEAKIRTYIQARGNSEGHDPLFASLSPRNKGGRMSTRSISRIIKETLRGAGYDSPRLTAHSMRHTAVTLALLGGATPQEAQAMARHSSISTTMIYAHNLDRVENAAELKVSNLLSASAREIGSRH